MLDLHPNVYKDGEIIDVIDYVDYNIYDEMDSTARAAVELLFVQNTCLRKMDVMF